MKYIYFISYTEIDVDGDKYNIIKSTIFKTKEPIDDIKFVERKLLKLKNHEAIHRILINSINFLHIIEEEEEKINI